MPNPFTLQGLRIQDTYPRVCQFISGSLYDGLGGSVTVTSASYAETASYAFYQISNEISSSWASESLSASYAIYAPTNDPLTASAAQIQFLAGPRNSGSGYSEITWSADVYPDQNDFYQFGSANKPFWRFYGTSSWADEAIHANTSSWAVSASLAMTANSASWFRIPYEFDTSSFVVQRYPSATGAAVLAVNPSSYTGSLTYTIYSFITINGVRCYGEGTTFTTPTTSSNKAVDVSVVTQGTPADSGWIFYSHVLNAWIELTPPTYGFQDDGNIIYWNTSPLPVTTTPLFVTLNTSSVLQITSSWADRAINANTSSWSILSISSSHSEESDESDYSLTTRGIIVEYAARDTTATGTGSVTHAATVYDTGTSNEASPHVSIKVGNKLYVAGWSGHVYRLETPDGDLANITTMSLSESYATPTGPRAISDGCYSSVTGQLYYILQATFPTSPSTASIVKVDPTTLSSSLFCDGLGSSTVDGLPPIVTDGNYLYVVTYNGNIYKIDAVSGSIVSSSNWTSASANITTAHAAKMDPSGDFFWVTTSGTAKIGKVSTTDLSSSWFFGRDSVGTVTYGLTDDFALLGDYIYPVFESGYLGFLKINRYTLSQSHNAYYFQSYGSFTDGNHLYFNAKAGPPSYEIWVFPYADLNLGPIRYTTAANSNEMGFTDGGKVFSTNWTSTAIATYELPFIEVGVGKSPDNTLDVAGTIHAPNVNVDLQVSASSIRSSTIVYSASLANTNNSIRLLTDRANFTVPITASGANAGLWIPYITASRITASSGLFGTASYADFATSASHALSLRGSASFTGKASGDNDLEVSGRLIGDIAVQGPVISASQYFYNNSYIAGNWLIQSSGSLSGPKALIQSQIEVNGGTDIVANVTGSLGGNADTSTSASHADFADSASWAPFTDTVGTTLYTASTYQITSSQAVSASWAPGAVAGTTLYTASTYEITASRAVSASWASMSLSASWAPFTDTVGTTLYTASTYEITASRAVNATSASWAPYVDTVGTTLYTASTYEITASRAVSASWASMSLSASWAPFTDTVGTTLYTASTYEITASRAVNATSASWAPFTDTVGTTLYTASTYQITSSWAVTASYAMNGGTNPPAAGVSQSWYDIPVKEMIMPNSAGLSEVQETSIVYAFRNSFQSYYYLSFPSRDGGGVKDWGYGTHIFRLPFNYSGSLTHSFQYIDTGNPALGGNGEIPNSVTSSKAYWEVKLYAVTSSNNPLASFLQDPILVERKVITQSLIGGNPASSGSVWSTSSYFNDPNSYLTSNTIVILNLIRVSTVEVGLAGDMSDYSASLGLISSQYQWKST